MQRLITGYHRDSADDWVAELDCLHAQHVRHNPPLVEREWVLSPAGRQAHLGSALNCLRCERLELPEGLSCYKRTPEFTADTIPAGLLREHRTKAGVWGLIQVLEGQLSYTLAEPLNRSLILDPETPGPVPPDLPHAIAPLGPVRLFVGFYRQEP